MYDMEYGISNVECAIWRLPLSPDTCDLTTVT